MLGSIRDRATGWIAGVIVGALIISFAFWGISFYFGGGGEVNVAKVNDADIDMQTYQRAFMNFRRQMQPILGNELTLEQEELLRQQTLQRLIDTEIINQVVKKNNLRVSQQQIASTIKNLELFQSEDGFDRYKYEMAIANLGMQPAFFEQQLRMDLLSEQLQAGLSESIFVTSDELERVLKMKNQTRDITYAILSIDKYVDVEDIPESEIESYYETNKNNYKQPEQIKIAYLELNVTELAEGIQATEEELRDYYQNNRDSYDVAEQRSVVKLSIKIDEETSEDDVKSARAVMETVLGMVNEGQDFEQIIENMKESSGKLEFSEHAFMTKGVMGDEIDEFLFSANENDTSGIIETKSGLNIVKVGEIRGGPKNNFENVAEQVENDYRIKQAELKFFEQADQLTTLAYEHPDSLEIAAEAIGQSVQNSDFFSRKNDNDDLTSNDRVIAAAFDQELINSGINSDAIDLGENHIAVIRVIEHKPAAIKTLETVREEVIADIKFNHAKEKLQDLGEDIISQLEDGINPEQVNTNMEINWFEETDVKRDAVGVNRSVLRTAFQMEVSKDSAAYEGYSMGSGDYAVIIVKNVKEGSLDDVAETASKAVDNDLRRIRGSSEWREFLNSVRESAEVRIFEENI
jgi:peptidyl-prolyl cis-trans isomerase D